MTDTQVTQPMKAQTQPMKAEPSGKISGKSLAMKLMASAGMRVSSLFPRELFSRMFGGSFGGERDYYKAFGWDFRLDNLMVWRMYARGGIAKRVVHAYGDTVWSNPPDMKATAAWTNKWESLIDDHNLWSIVNRLDVLCQLGAYSVLLVGLNGSGPMNTPLVSLASGPDDILYLQPYSSRSAVITRWGTDPTDARFGLPVEYTIYPGIARTEETLFGGAAQGQPIMVPSQASYKVHWSRVMHFNTGALENDVFGTPMLWGIWNYLTDLQKVVGGSSESYWMTANRGMQADIDKEMDLGPEDEAALEDEIDEYVNNQRRFIRTRGVKITDLGGQVSDPSGPLEALLTLITGTTGIPKRILVGAESAHQASTQDKGTWAERIIEYRNLKATPGFLKVLVAGFQRMGIIPQVKWGKITKVWPDAYQLSPLESAQAANQWATAANNLGLALKNVPNLATVEEVRMRGLGIIADDGKIVPGTKAEPPSPGGTPDTPMGDGGGAGEPTGGGTKATPTSDSNSKGAPAKSRKATSK